MLGAGEAVVLAIAASCILLKILPIYAFILIVIGALTSLYRYLQTTRDVGTKIGIPTPPQSLLLGHFGEIRKKGLIGSIEDWIKEYGDLVMLNFFASYNVVIADVDLLKQIFVKDFNVFTNHRGSPLLDNDSDSIMAHMLTIIKDQRWKDVRNSVTPAFTAGKMKLMVPLVNDCADTFVEILKEKMVSEEAFDVKKLCGNYTMDVVAAAAFGQRVNAQKVEDSEFVKNAKEVFAFNDMRDPYLMFLLLFPNFTYYTNKYLGIRWMLRNAEPFFKNTLKNIFEQRKKNPKTKPDFLQLLINAQESGEKAETDDLISHGDIGAKNVRLTEAEMISQSFLFLVAGFETTATTLQFVLYTLATHPDIQKKCRDEVRMLAGGESFTYEVVQRMTYLESVILETLRLYPPAPFTDRMTGIDYEIEGKVIPKDTVILAPIYYIHHNPIHYPDPETFDPDRFTPEERKRRNPVTFLPFGFGPRNCIGMRFAQMEIKLVMAAFLRELEIVAYDETPSFPLELSKHNSFCAPAKKIFLKAQKIRE